MQLLILFQISYSLLSLISVLNIAICLIEKPNHVLPQCTKKYYVQFDLDIVWVQEDQRLFVQRFEVN